MVNIKMLPEAIAAPRESDNENRTFLFEICCILLFVRRIDETKILNGNGLG